MKKEIIVPNAGESIAEATLSQWNKKNGEYVKKDELILTLETDKASQEIVAEYAGTLTTEIEEGTIVAIGAKLGEIDTSASPPQPNPAASTTSPKSASPPLSPAVRKIVAENNIDTQNMKGSGKNNRITKGDLLTSDFVLKKLSANESKKDSSYNQQDTASSHLASEASKEGDVTRKPLSLLRKTVARRLVQVQQTAAILTTFNEINMSQVMKIRQTYKEAFKEKHGISLGFMGFFVRATLLALKKFPQVGSYIDGDDLVFTQFVNMGIAVSTERGLLVPVIKRVDKMRLSDIELAIRQYAIKARDGKIALEDLSGGTFTISNGGVFGSLMSTPILNPPQSGILGLHKIEDRPIAVDGQVLIRPMMYVALSYDHRVIDGKESVGFLLSIKESLEDPSRLLLDI